MGISSLIQQYGGKIGKQAFWLADKKVMRMPITVLDAAEISGNVRFLVTPIGGTGEKWIDEKYIEFPITLNKEEVMKK